MSQSDTFPAMLREGGEGIFNELLEADHPYLRYLGSLSSGIAAKVEDIGTARTDMDDVYARAVREVITLIPQVSELSPVEIGTPETIEDLKVWTLGCVTSTLVNGWVLGGEFNDWVQRNVAPDLPTYSTNIAA